MAKGLLLLIIAGVAVWWFTRDPVEVAYQKCLRQVAAGQAHGGHEVEAAGRTGHAEELAARA